VSRLQEENKKIRLLRRKEKQRGHQDAVVDFLDNGKTVPAFMFLGRIWPILQQNVLKHPAKGS
jgi:hypothetical protein